MNVGRLVPPLFPLLAAGRGKDEEKQSLSSSLLFVSFVLFLDLLRPDFHLFSLLADGMRPAQDAAQGSFLACHQLSSDWSTTSSRSPRLNAIPASGHGMEASCRGQ